VRRRDFITLLGGAAAWPLAAGAEQGERIRRIGVLMPSAADDPEFQARITAFLQGLAQLGWLDGRNVRIDSRWGVADADRIRKYAAELVALAPDVILANSSAAVAPLLQATRTVPIVFTTVADPVGAGYVDSLARPGGNVTGFSSTQADIEGKGLEIFKDMVPGLARVAVLVPRIARNLFASAQEGAAKALGIDLLYIDLPGPEAAGTAMRQAISAGAQGALMRVGPFTSSSQRQAIVDLAAELRLPMSYDRRDYIEQGGLLTYAPDHADLYRRAAGYVVAILAGADPGDLPMEQPTKFELMINLKTAKALGLEVPLTLLARADEVIE